MIAPVRQLKWPMRRQLLLAICIILVVCQAISIFWLWHESKEQIQLMVKGIVEGRNNNNHIRREVHEAVASLLLPSLAIIGLALWLCLHAVTRITRPLLTLQRELNARTPDNLQPIALTSSVSEIDAVTGAINQLVDRLNQTLERERLFTADVAHELRTPLAGLRLHLELLAKTSGIAVDPLLQRLDLMTESITQLLQLARVGQSFSAGSYQRVALAADVIRPVESDLSAMLRTRGQILRLKIALPEISVSGDATLLRLLLRNLVENAHRYSPPNSVITVSAGGGVLAVEDEGPGIDEAKSGELTRAFVRMDSGYGGIGLGLSIVARIAQLHDAQLFLQNRRSASGTRAWVTFRESGSQ